MSRYLLFILSITLLSGCSEMKIIGNAALRELRAEGMNVEQISYNYHAKLAAMEKAGYVMMAKADTGQAATGGKVYGEGKKIRAKKVKGLWEKSSL